MLVRLILKHHIFAFETQSVIYRTWCICGLSCHSSDQMHFCGSDCLVPDKVNLLLIMYCTRLGAFVASLSCTISGAFLLILSCTRLGTFVVNPCTVHEQLHLWLILFCTSHVHLWLILYCTSQMHLWLILSGTRPGVFVTHPLLYQPSAFVTYPVLHQPDVFVTYPVLHQTRCICDSSSLVPAKCICDLLLSCKWPGAFVTYSSLVNDQVHLWLSLTSTKHVQSWVPYLVPDMVLVWLNLSSIKPGAELKSLSFIAKVTFSLCVLKCGKFNRHAVF